MADRAAQRLPGGMADLLFIALTVSVFALLGVVLAGLERL
jgi:hypothetical protein